MSDQIPETPAVEEPVEYVQIPVKEYEAFKKDHDDMKNAITRMAGLLDGIATKVSQLASANNAIATFINGIAQHQPLIDAVAAEVITIVQAAETKIEDQVAETIYQYHLERLYAQPETVDDCIDTYEAVYELRDEVPEGSDDNCLLHVKKYDADLGEYVVADPMDPRDGIILKAISRYIQDNTVDPNEPIYLKHHEQPINLPTPPVGDFQQFMESAMPKSDQRGVTTADTTIAREYFDGALRVVFREREEADEAIGYVQCYERSSSDEWAPKPIDSELGMYYISLIQSQGGLPGEDWFIAHR